MSDTRQKYICMRCGDFHVVGTEYQKASELAAPHCYGAAQLIDIFCELQRNVDNAACALRCGDFAYAEVQLRVAHEKAEILRAERERHNEKVSDGCRPRAHDDTENL